MMKGFKNIHLSTQFIRVIFILLSLLFDSFGKFLEKLEIQIPDFADFPHPTGKNMWIHWNLGQTLKLTKVPHESISDSVIREHAVSTYVNSLEDLLRLIGESPSTILMRKDNEVSGLFKGSDGAKKAWGLVNLHYSHLHNSMSSIKEGKEWLQKLEGMYRILIVDIPVPAFDDFPHPTRKNVWIHWNLGEAIQLSNVDERKIDPIISRPAVANYVNSVEHLLRVMGERPSKILAKKNNEVSGFFQSSDIAKTAWVLVNLHYNHLHTSITFIEGGTEWLKWLEGLEEMYKHLAEML
ncbi:hypothetical protein DFH28DRAFT_1105748 [Melampsora americana]|nr:hypothetical protein DFH28DRAFT_1105748 [Melampsora americana]